MLFASGDLKKSFVSYQPIFLLLFHAVISSLYFYVVASFDGPLAAKAFRPVNFPSILNKYIQYTKTHNAHGIHFQICDMSVLTHGSLIMITLKRVNMANCVLCFLYVKLIVHVNELY